MRLQLDVTCADFSGFTSEQARSAVTRVTNLINNIFAERAGLRTAFRVAAQQGRNEVLHRLGDVIADEIYAAVSGADEEASITKRDALALRLHAALQATGEA